MVEKESPRLADFSTSLRFGPWPRPRADQAIWNAIEVALRARFAREHRPDDWFTWLDQHTERQKQATVNLKRVIDYGTQHAVDTSWIDNLHDEQPLPLQPERVVGIVFPRPTDRPGRDH